MTMCTVKRSILTLLVSITFLGIWAPNGFCKSVPPGQKGDTLQVRSVENRCITRVNEFLKWYVSFAKTDDSLRHVQKLVRKHGTEYYRIDTLGAEKEVNRCHQSGFFTRSWKEHEIRGLLAADRALSKIKTNNVAAFGDIAVPGLVGDPVLSLNSPKGWFQPGYKWQVKRLKRLGHGIISVDLLLDSGWGPTEEWTIYLKPEGGQLRIDRVSVVGS